MGLNLLVGGGPAQDIMEKSAKTMTNLPLGVPGMVGEVQPPPPINPTNRDSSRRIPTIPNLKNPNKSQKTNPNKSRQILTNPDEQNPDKCPQIPTNPENESQQIRTNPGNTTENTKGRSVWKCLVVGVAPPSKKKMF
eukprot:EG_transcript_36017